MKKSLQLLILIQAVILLTGCDIQIFEDKSQKGVAKEYKREDLETDTYYIKDGTSFYEAYECDASSAGTDLDYTRCCWLIDDEKMVPTYYKDGLIAWMTNSKIEDESVIMERYKDYGYSIGVYGCTFENGLIYFQMSNSAIKDTSFFKELDQADSPNIMIETINGTYVTENMLSEAGIILGMEEGKEYDITYYAGSVYREATVTADTHFFQCFEAYKLDEYSTTKNGYISLTVPEDLKSGFYRLDGEVLFRYVADAKGTDLASLDYNDPYYESEEDQMAVFSQQYVFSLDRITENMSVKADFEPNSVLNTNGIVKMMVTSPDNKRMTVEAYRDEGTISCDIKESTPGEWIVNISPQSMTVKNIEVVSNEDEMEATKEELELVLDRDMTGIVVTLEYEGEGILTAQIVNPENNKSFDMIEDSTVNNNDKKHRMIYNFPYLAQGSYKVYIYHYPDTKIGELSYYLSEDVKDIEIISVEE